MLIIIDVSAPIRLRQARTTDIAAPAPIAVGSKEMGDAVLKEFQRASG